VSNVWRLDVDPDTTTITGGPHRITAVTESVTGLSLARGVGLVAFGVPSGNARVLLASLTPDGHRLTGEERPLTPESHEGGPIELASNGTAAVYTLEQPGGAGEGELRLHDLATDRDRVLRTFDAGSGEIVSQLQFSPDGRRVVFRHVAPASEGAGRGGGLFGRQRLRMIDTTTDQEIPITSDAAGVELAGGWSPDGQLIVVTAQRVRYSPGQGVTGSELVLYPVAAAPRAESQRRLVTSVDQGALWQGVMSPNGRWIAFNRTMAGTQSQVAIVGSRDGTWLSPVAEPAWLRLGDQNDGIWRDKPRWSTDGRLVYYLARADGHVNVWGNPFDPETGTLGAAFQVTNFAGPDEHIPTDLTSFEFDVVDGILAVPVRRRTGGIWSQR
jgi:Tol biopolymer transport system component